MVRHTRFSSDFRVSSASRAVNYVCVLCKIVILFKNQWFHEKVTFLIDLLITVGKRVGEGNVENSSNDHYMKTNRNELS